MLVAQGRTGLNFTLTKDYPNGLYFIYSDPRFPYTNRIFLTRGTSSEVEITSYDTLIASQGTTTGGEALTHCIYPFLVGDKIRIQNGAGSGDANIIFSIE